MITEIVFIFIFTLILIGLLVPVGRYRSYHSIAYRNRVAARDEEPAPEGVGIGLTMLFFFFILFPLILAGSFWIGPYGPMFMEISWVPIVVLGILLALLVAALSPRERGPVTSSATEPEERVAAGLSALFGVAFFFLFFAAVAIIVGAFI